MNEQVDRLEELTVKSRPTVISRGYTTFVKSMRFILPAVALILIIITFLWPKMEDKVVIIPKEKLISPSETEIGENELLNPRFETTDSQQQPVNITADKALQNQENPNLVRLDKPNADLKTKDGSNVKIEALDGTYEQETEKLFLQNDVKIQHESGYELQAKELRVDMKSREAFSDKKVKVVGPDAQIDAIGLEGNMSEGILIFKGPAKLTLHPKKDIDNTEQPPQNIQEQLVP